MENKIIVQITKNEANEEFYQRLTDRDDSIFITVNDDWLNIYEADLVKLKELPQEWLEQATNSPICPCCGRKVTRGLVQDYRENGGCLSKKIVCLDCRYIADKKFWQLYCAEDNEKLELVLALLKPGEVEYYGSKKRFISNVSKCNR